MSWLATPVLLMCALAAIALAHRAMSARYPRDDEPLVDAIDALLPQTQCAQCGYPGCRPYAEAIAAGSTALNLCPPGGATLHHQLIDLMGAEQTELPPTEPCAVVAVIDEARCIGCALCLPPCPVDAIVGAANKMHTVIEQVCTGCELCVPACPVDCISLHALDSTPISDGDHPGISTHARACINCARCDPVCPVDLPVQALWQAVNRDNSARAVEQGLMQCIECRLCDQACPSLIPLAARFGTAKQAQQHQQTEVAARQRHKARFQAHLERQAQVQQSAAEKRTARLRNRQRWS
jgi:electron transport complex protein RnfB